MEKEIKVAHVDLMDLEELACKILGLDYDKVIEEDSNIIWEKLYDDLDITSEAFEMLVKRLMPYSCVSKSELTSKVYNGFADHENSCWIIKSEIK